MFPPGETLLGTDEEGPDCIGRKPFLVFLQLLIHNISRVKDKNKDRIENLNYYPK